MNENQVLDDLKEEPKPTAGFRKLPVVLEILPYTFIFMAAVKNSLEFVMYGAVYLLANYLLFSWYFFKAAKFKILDILIAELCGFIFLLGTIGFLFKLESWNYANELLIVSLGLSTPISLYLIYRYTTRKEEPLEYRYSFKLLSRIFFFTALLGYFLFRYR